MSALNKVEGIVNLNSLNYDMLKSAVCGGWGWGVCVCVWLCWWGGGGRSPLNISMRPFYLSMPRSRGYKTFSCSTQLSKKFQLLIKTERKRLIKKLLTLRLSNVVFIMLINVKMPTIVGVLTFMSKIKFVLS